MSATVEFKHDSTRHGLVLALPWIDRPGKLRHFCENVMDLAGSLAWRDVTDPGWWAAVASCAAVREYEGAPAMQRVHFRDDLHAVFFVERGRMLEEFPEWPLVRTSEGGLLYDLRGPNALDHGPSDAALLRYRDSVDFEGDAPAVHDLRRMFDTGVLEWDSAPAPGKRWAVRRAR